MQKFRNYAIARSPLKGTTKHGVISTRLLRSARNDPESVFCNLLASGEDGQLKRFAFAQEADAVG
jgi:hypothetical protein